MNLGKEPILFYEEGGKTMKEFWKLLRDSVIIQGVVTVLFCGTTCYLVVTGQAVPGELWGANGVVLGYFFGAKTQSVIQSKLK